MFRNALRLLCLVVIAAVIVGCDDRKEDILKKSENVKTRKQLRAAIGDPDNASIVGPIETWTYEASNGRVTFTFAGDTMMLKTTGDRTD